MGARRGGGDVVKKSLGKSGRWAEHCHEPLSMCSEGGCTCTFWNPSHCNMLYQQIVWRCQIIQPKLQTFHSLFPT
jgi:hypothetical protein